MTDNNWDDWESIEAAFPGVDPSRVITPDMLRKRVMWDIVPDEIADQVVREMGMQSASSDVEDMEKREAHARLDALAPILPVLGALATHASESLVAAMIVGYGADGIPADTKEEAMEKLTPLILAASLGMLAELLDVDILHLPHYLPLTGDDQ